MTLSDDISGAIGDSSDPHRVLSVVPFVAILLDPDGRVRYVNDTYAAWYGRKPPPRATLVDLLGEPAAALTAACHPDRDATLAWEGQLAGREVEATCHTDVDDGGVPRGTVVLLHDVSARRQAEREARALTEEAERLRDLFLGMLGHDLRGPMSTIATAASYLLRYANLANGHGRALARISTSAERGARMIEQLLDYTRSRLGGGVPIHPAPADLGAIVAAVIDELEIVHPDRHFVVEQDGDLTGHWDRDRLAEAVANLIGNAAAHGTARSDIHVTVAASDGHVTLAVENEGQPIPRDVLPVRFDPLRRRRVDPRPRAGRNLGLGLYITREVVAAHGGTIEARSRRGERTMFRMTLPRTAAPAATPRGGGGDRR